MDRSTNARAQACKCTLAKWHEGAQTRGHTSTMVRTGDPLDVRCAARRSEARSVYHVVYIRPSGC
eukprot:13215702-Alexandrium_andersonii.AAC.1